MPKKTNAWVERYSLFEIWTPQEACHLLIGADPTGLAIGEVAEDVAERVVSLAELAARSGHHDNSPAGWVAWADRVAVDVPPDVRAAVVAKATEREAEEKRQKTTKARVRSSDETKRINTVLKMFYGVASHLYDFECGKPLPRALATKISNDLELAGLKVSRDTIATYLKQCEDLFAE